MVSFKITNITYDTYDEEAEEHQTQEDLGLPTEMVVQIELQGDEEEWEIYDLLTYQIENQGYGWLVESFDFDTESKSAEDDMRTTVQSLITWIRNKPNPNRYTDAPDTATLLPKGDYLITDTIDTYYNLNNENPDKWVKEEVPFTYDGIRLNEWDIINL